MPEPKIHQPKTSHLAVMISDQLRAALDHAASRRFTTASEYARQSLIEKMRADGVEPTEIRPSEIQQQQPVAA